MVGMSIVMNAEGMAEGKEPDHHVTSMIKVGVLEEGMESGRPSVAMLITLENGETVLVETSLLLFQTAARAFAARYGWIADREI